MRAIGAQSRRTFIGATRRQSRSVKGIDGGACRGNQGGHGPVANGGRLAIKGPRDPEPDARRGGFAVADLIRLNPGVDAYSVNLDGVAPQAVSRYRPAPWADVAAPGAGDREGAVVRLLSASYPAVDLATLSERVRAAGHPLGRGQLRAHEAIAATQAAIWHVTNGTTPQLAQT